MGTGVVAGAARTSPANRLVRNLNNRRVKWPMVKRPTVMCRVK